MTIKRKFTTNDAFWCTRYQESNLSETEMIRPPFTCAAKLTETG